MRPARAHRDFPVVALRDGAYLGLVRARMLLHAAPDARVRSVADSIPPLAPDDPLETSGLLDGELSAAAVVTDGRVLGLVRAADAELLTLLISSAAVRPSVSTGAERPHEGEEHD